MSESGGDPIGEPSPAKELSSRTCRFTARGHRVARDLAASLASWMGQENPWCRQPVHFTSE